MLESSVEWRLNSENDSRLHGQPSIAGAAGHVGSWAFYPGMATADQLQRLLGPVTDWFSALQRRPDHWL
jgi:hypothetical protein